MRRVRTLIVDDSAAMCALIEAALAADPWIEVVGCARDAAAARVALVELRPDVVTLDVEMPGTNGLEFLAEIMNGRSTPVVMMAAHTAASARVAARARELGAYDFVLKPRGKSDARVSFADLARKVRAAGRNAARAGIGEAAGLVGRAFAWNGRVVGLGASAGGIEAIQTIVSRLPADGPPILVVQHIPAAFAPRFAERLNREGDARVQIAEHGARLVQGTVYIAPGDRHLMLEGGPGAWRCALGLGLPVNGFRPSIDVLFESMAEAAGGRAVAAILSGLGRDGVNGLAALRRAGAHTFGQDEATSRIYGMPRAAFEAGAVERQGPPEALADLILRCCNVGSEGKRA